MFNEYAATFAPLLQSVNKEFNVFNTKKKNCRLTLINTNSGIGMQEAEIVINRLYNTKYLNGTSSLSKTTAIPILAINNNIQNTAETMIFTKSDCSLMKCEVGNFPQEFWNEFNITCTLERCSIKGLPQLFTFTPGLIKEMISNISVEKEKGVFLLKNNDELVDDYLFLPLDSNFNNCAVYVKPDNNGYFKIKTVKGNNVVSQLKWLLTLIVREKKHL